MISRLQQHLKSDFPFLSGKKLLLAVSGGLDSMVLAELFLKCGSDIVVAHCNFRLRGQESDEDEQFVREYAQRNGIPFFATHFDTQAFAADYKLSIQVAARQLRYNWFYELLEKENFDFALTAHHADDNLETFLVNFSRGTGLEGLTGIPPQNDRILRPLLVFSRKEIEDFATENEVQWREDSSNRSDKYLRNKLRHTVIPLLKELNPNFLDSFQNTLKYLEQSQSLADDASRIVYRKVVSDDDGTKKINLKELLQLPNYKAYIFQWIKLFGFTAWDDIYNLVHAQSGKQVFSDGFVLLKDREFLILSPKTTQNGQDSYPIQAGQANVNFPINLSFCKVADISAEGNDTIFVDENRLEFPLTIRKWKQGDVFQPAGMNGQSKKLSKFFKDEKLSLPEKERVWLLCSGGQIVWIIGKRQDERFRITHETQTILKIDIHHETEL